ncbi:MAG TPA: NADH-quinone oxidoreductase subunit NuoE, partial [Bacteroidales bacterium]|nr:NADH-quinone oxidoreductase subunit NuoE [Bacteroidales bacterium]
MRIQRIFVENDNRKTPDDVVITNELDEIITKYKGKKGNIIPLLQGTQAIFGYLPRAAFEKISKETGLELSDMYGVATFYTQFRLNPVGKNIIKVCHGTACHVQNANAVSEALAEELGIKDGETTADGLFTLESVACLGCCSLAPVMMVNNDTFGKLNNKSA